MPNETMLQNSKLLGIVVISSGDILHEVLLVNLLMPGEYRREEGGSRCPPMFRARLESPETSLLLPGGASTQMSVLIGRLAPNIDERNQKLRKRKSLALASTYSRIAGSGSMRAIATAPIMVEKIEKKARSLSAVRLPGIKGIIRSL